MYPGARMDHSAAFREDAMEYPRAISVIGGGLWSRVITSELCKVLPSEAVIRMHSAHNGPLLQAWADRQGLASRVRIDFDWPDLNDGESRALIIANAARDHALAVERALISRIPALVEKPFTLTADETRRLVHRAQALGSPLAASHVFLFARFFQRFTEILEQAGAMEQLTICWADPAAEIRHGERKGYDPSLPLPVDVLPHISSLIGALLPGRAQSITAIEIFRGGAALNLELRAGSIPCSVNMARNAVARQRLIKVTTSTQVFRLDFTAAPTVAVGDQVIDPDPDWGIADGPLACMLKTFLHGAVSGLFDSRLSLDAALAANELADEASRFYREAVFEWLSATLSQPEPEDEENLRYALREHYLAAAYREPTSVDSMIESVINDLRGAAAETIKHFIEWAT
jgi:predicted dehydrogenase